MFRKNLVFYYVACYKLFFLEVAKKSFFAGNFDIFLIWSLNGEFLTFSRVLGGFIVVHWLTLKLVTFLFYIGSMIKADKINTKNILYLGINNRRKPPFFDLILTSKNFQTFFLDIFFQQKVELSTWLRYKIG